MNEKQEELRQKLAEVFGSAPKQILKAVVFSIALGFLLPIHAILFALSSGKFSDNTVFFGVIQFFVFLINAVSLPRRSRISYVLIVVFALLPLLGSLAGAVHLLALTVSGNIGVNVFDTLSSIVALFQCATIIALFYYIFSPASRSYVWRETSEIVSAPELLS